MILNSTSDLKGAGLDKDYILQYSMSKGEWLESLFPISKVEERIVFEGYNKNPNSKNMILYQFIGEIRLGQLEHLLGAIAFALLMFMFFGTRERLKWPVIIIGGLAVILSWRDASFVTDFFLENVPMFSKFRDTKMMLCLFN